MSSQSKEKDQKPLTVTEQDLNFLRDNPVQGGVVLAGAVASGVSEAVESKVGSVVKTAQSLAQPGDMNISSAPHPVDDIVSGVKRLGTALERLAQPGDMKVGNNDPVGAMARDIGERVNALEHVGVVEGAHVASSAVTAAMIEQVDPMKKVGAVTDVADAAVKGMTAADRARFIARHPMETLVSVIEGNGVAGAADHVAENHKRIQEMQHAASQMPHPGAPSKDQIDALIPSQVMQRARDAAELRAVENSNGNRSVLDKIADQVGWGALVSQRHKDELLLSDDSNTLRIMLRQTAEKMVLTKVAAVPLGLAGATYYASHSKEDSTQLVAAFAESAGVAEKEMKHPELKERFATYHAVVSAAIQHYPAQAGVSPAALEEIKQGSAAIVERIQKGMPEPHQQSSLTPHEQLVAHIKTLPPNQQDILMRVAEANKNAPELG